jgi:hypothetical protein
MMGNFEVFKHLSFFHGTRAKFFIFLQWPHKIIKIFHKNRKNYLIFKLQNKIDIFRTIIAQKSLFFTKTSKNVIFHHFHTKLKKLPHFAHKQPKKHVKVSRAPQILSSPKIPVPHKAHSPN